MKNNSQYFLVVSARRLYSRQRRRILVIRVGEPLHVIQNSQKSCGDDPNLSAFDNPMLG